MYVLCLYDRVLSLNIGCLMSGSEARDRVLDVGESMPPWTSNPWEEVSAQFYTNRWASKQLETGPTNHTHARFTSMLGLCKQCHAAMMVSKIMAYIKRPTSNPPTIMLGHPNTVKHLLMCEYIKVCQCFVASGTS